MPNNLTQFADQYVLTDKVAVVTGGGKGLGKTITEYLLAQGMKVAICGRTEAHLVTTVEQLSVRYSERIIAKVCDVSDSIQVQAFHQFVEKKFGSAEVLINNSGFGKETLVWQTPEKDWDEVMNTNVKGVYLMASAFLPNMIANKAGYILNIASQAALNGYANAGVYCASKFALVGLSKALQEEVSPYGIHVHSLNPALIQSQKTASDAVDNGLIQNEDLARMTVYLLQQPRRLKIDNIGMWGF
ncbi:MAG: SDR family oxidoreductase [Thalassotalea sp.]